MENVAVIAGASGLVGRECLCLLLDRYDSVISLVRKPTGLAVRMKTKDPVAAPDLPKSS